MRLLAFASSLVLAATTAAATTESDSWAPNIIFNCKLMPEACTNMCWAMRCATPNFPHRLTWDHPDEQEEDLRRVSAGCRPEGNKCRGGGRGQGYKGGAYIVCSAYPFWTTLENKENMGRQVSRCIRRSTNNRHGRQIRTLTHSWSLGGLTSHSLQVAMAEPDHKGVQYCMNQPCKNDGFQIQAEKAQSHVDDFDDPPDFRFYKLKTGELVASMQELVTGGNFTYMSTHKFRNESGTIADEVIF